MSINSLTQFEASTIAFNGDFGLKNVKYGVEVITTNDSGPCQVCIII